jgi:hypothetical protein
MNKYQIAKVTKEGVTISEPFAVQTTWSYKVKEMSACRTFACTVFMARVTWRCRQSRFFMVRRMFVYGRGLWTRPSTLWALGENVLELYLHASEGSCTPRQRRMWPVSPRTSLLFPLGAQHFATACPNTAASSFRILMNLLALWLLPSAGCNKSLSQSCSAGTPTHGFSKL